jgi:hypothetical protein
MPPQAKKEMCIDRARWMARLKQKMHDQNNSPPAGGHMQPAPGSSVMAAAVDLSSLHQGGPLSVGGLGGGGMSPPLSNGLAPLSNGTLGMPLSAGITPYGMGSAGFVTAPVLEPMDTRKRK